MKNFVITGIIMLLCLISCKDNSIAYSDKSLYLENIVTANINKDLSTLGYVLRKKTLSLSEHGFLTGNSHVVFVSQKDSSFFVSDGKIIYRFNNDGVLKNTIGIIGHGHMEYQNIFSASFDSDEGTVHIYTGNNKIIIYSFEGMPIECVDLKSEGYIGGAYRIKGGYWAESLFIEKGISKVSVMRFDNKGTIKNETTLTTFKANNNDYFPSPIVNQQQALAYQYYCHYTAEVYNINEEDVECILTIDGGKYSFTGDKINDMDFKTNNRDSFVEILDIHQTNESIYLLYTIDRKIYAGIIDIISGKCIFNYQIGNPLRGGGIGIYENNKIKTWPQYVFDANLFSIAFEETDGKAATDRTEKPSLLILKKL